MVNPKFLYLSKKIHRLKLFCYNGQKTKFPLKTKLKHETKNSHIFLVQTKTRGSDYLPSVPNVP